MVHYGNGTVDANGYYSGIAVADETVLLTQLRDNLVTGGWTVVTDDIANLALQMKGTDDGDDCYVNFNINVETGVGRDLLITGDLDGQGTDVPEEPVKIPLIVDGNSKLYVTTDASSACISVFNPAGETKASHFGFLNRRDTNNAFAWMIGYLDVWLSESFIAKSTIDGIIWAEMQKYYTATESKTNPSGVYQFVWDSLTTGVTATSRTSSNSSSFGYKPWLGAIDPVLGQPILGLYGYLEGRIPSNTYPVDASNATALHFPGEVKFARTGLASLSPGVQCKEGTKTFLSAGSVGQFQGFQISD